MAEDADGGVVELEAGAIEEGVAEGWIGLTQSTLGRFVTKPRLMADRLRKPPFRFLFDVAVEIARQTGFGVSELFGGNLPAKPAPPATRDLKIAFLDQWVHLLQWSLGPPISGDLTACNPNNIVCGIKPEWTNYLLQCTAAAAYPEQVAVPPRMALEAAEPSALMAQFMEPAPAAATENMVPLAPVAPDVLQPPAEQAEPLVGPSDVAGYAVEAPPVPPPPPVEQDPVDTTPDMSVEQAREIASGMDFGSALDQFEGLQKDFAITAEKWHVPKTAALDEDSEDSSDDDMPKPPAAPPMQAPPAPITSAARAPLIQAQERAGRVNEEITRAQDLMDQIEEGFDRTDAFAKAKWAAAKAKEDSGRQAEADAEVVQQAAAEQEAVSAEEAARLKAERKLRKKALKAEKERVAAEEAAKPFFPQSKHSQEQAQSGPRIVSMLGDEDEYAWDGDEGDEGEPLSPTAEEPLSPPPPAVDRGGVADFDFSSCLGEDPAGPPVSLLSSVIPQGESVLFGRLKVQLKDTYISYLCASMPSFLLKQYSPGELVGCLQFLLSELRKCLAQHSLEDVADEEPTTLAEDLHERFPMDWLIHVLDSSALTLCGSKYDVPELIDTLQSLSQSCVDRLEENLGAIQSWVDESNPLRYIPPAEPLLVETPPAAEESEDPMSAPSTHDGPWSSALAPANFDSTTYDAAPLQHQQHAQSRGMTGMAQTMGDFRQRQPSPVPRLGTGAPPTFDSTLGPALWEQEPTGPALRNATAAPGMPGMRHATAAPGMRGAGHPMTSYGAPNNRPLTMQTHGRAF